MKKILLISALAGCIAAYAQQAKPSSIVQEEMEIYNKIDVIKSKQLKPSEQLRVVLLKKFIERKIRSNEQ